MPRLGSRFVAEWIVAQHVVDGEWDPDRDEYARSTHMTLDDAKAAAIAGSKKANVVEWWRVAELEFQPHLKIPARNPAAWDTVRVWHGDWEGNCDEERWT